MEDRSAAIGGIYTRETVEQKLGLLIAKQNATENNGKLFGSAADKSNPIIRMVTIHIKPIERANCVTL